MSPFLGLTFWANAPSALGALGTNGPEKVNGLASEELDYDDDGELALLDGSRRKLPRANKNQGPGGGNSNSSPSPDNTKKWRNDSRCGKDYPLENGKPGECDPRGDYPCCSDMGWCGNSQEHCDGDQKVDYKLRDTANPEFTSCLEYGEHYHGIGAAIKSEKITKEGGQSQFAKCADMCENDTGCKCFKLSETAECSLYEDLGSRTTRRGIWTVIREGFHGNGESSGVSTKGRGRACKPEEKTTPFGIIGESNNEPLITTFKYGDRAPTDYTQPGEASAETKSLTNIAFAGATAVYQQPDERQKITKSTEFAHFKALGDDVAEEFAQTCANKHEFVFKPTHGTNYDSEAFVFKKTTDESGRKFAILAFRGTETDSWRDVFLSDLNIFDVVGSLVQWKKLGESAATKAAAYRGFAIAFLDVRQWLHRNLDELKREDYEILFTGHSLGGSLAYLASLYAVQFAGYPSDKITTITFAAPKTGNKEWVAMYQEAMGGCDRTVGYYNGNDSVPKVPPFAEMGNPCYRESTNLNGQFTLLSTLFGGGDAAAWERFKSGFHYIFSGQNTLAAHTCANIKPELIKFAKNNNFGSKFCTKQ